MHDIHKIFMHEINITLAYYSMLKLCNPNISQKKNVLTFNFKFHDGESHPIFNNN